MSKLPAVAAGILLGSLIATSAAHGATARIDPVLDTTRTGYATATVITHNQDACAMRYGYVVLASERGGPILPVFASPRLYPVNACLPGMGTVYEDGSASTRIGGAFMSTASLRPGRYFLAINLYSHARYGGAPWVRHTYLRSFWHRSSASLSTARIAF